ncbi:hypothetical protein ONZ45_g8718 [Pleurotus djamor]|nr:hypothetical protein ONZ45_g8718 [Pleurotus djamor]
MTHPPFNPPLPNTDQVLNSESDASTDDDLEEVVEPGVAQAENISVTYQPPITFLPLPDSRAALREQLLEGYVLEPEPPSLGLRAVPLTELQIHSLRTWILWRQTHGTQLAFTGMRKLISSTIGATTLSRHSCVKLAQKLTGFEPTLHHICPNKCIAYVGQYKDLRSCPFRRRSNNFEICGASRYITSKKGERPAAQFRVFPVIPTIRAMFANTESAKLLRYRDRTLRQAVEMVKACAGGFQNSRYSDYPNGRIHINQHLNKNLFQNECDLAWIVSMDGAMLSMKKQSDVWFLILILLNLPPEIRYKSRNVITVFATPGPQGPGDLESFMWPVYVEMAKMSEGFWIWDAVTRSNLISRGETVLANADMPGQGKIDGSTGPTGLWASRHKLVMGARTNKKRCKRQYFPSVLSEVGKLYNSTRPEYNYYDLPELSQSQYWDIIARLKRASFDQVHKSIIAEFGITRMPLVAVSNSYEWPHFFPSDPFHLFYENIIPYFWDLWTKYTEPTEIPHMTADVAAQFGTFLVEAQRTLPPDLCGPIRDVHLKRNSQYKAYEWMALGHWYIYPFLLELQFPSIVTDNFSEFVHILEFATKVVPRDDVELDGLQDRIIKFLHEFERIYVPNKDVSKINRMRLCVFQLIHIPTHIRNNGSYYMGSQATIERQIGVLGRQIHSKKNPYSELANIIYEDQLVKNLLQLYPALKICDPEKESAPHVDFPFVGTKLTMTMAEKKAANQFTEYGRQREAMIQAGAVDIDDKWRRYGRLTLENGHKLRSRDEEQRESGGVTRSSRYFEVRYLISFVPTLSLHASLLTPGRASWGNGVRRGNMLLCSY